MTNVHSTETSETSLTHEAWHIVRYYLGRPRMLLVIAVIALVGGIALNWSWLVAVGLAPILIAFLPCAIMCAFGLCMHGRAHDRGHAATHGPLSQPTYMTDDPQQSMLSRAPATREAMSCCSGGGNTAAPAEAVAPTSAEKQQPMAARKDAEA